MTDSYSQLDKYLPQKIRTEIEQRYYAKVNAQSRLEQVKHDADFLRDPQHHVALFADHGVVHARDVARQILQVIDVVNGVLVPARDVNRLEFMRGYGVMVAYLHDIGMMDFTTFGRGMHPEFAAQTVFEPAFDDIVARVVAHPVQ